MKLTSTHHLRAPRDRVHAGLTDPAVLQQLITGCEKIVPTGPDSYDAHLKLTIAGIEGRHVAHLQLREIRPPTDCTLLVEARGGPGSVKGSVRVRLEERAGGTDAVCDAEVTVGGLLAAFASNQVGPATERALTNFFRRLEAIAGKQ